MIRLCACGKWLGIKKLFKKGITHGLCQDCFDKQIFKIKGYTFKWLKYNGWKQLGYNSHFPAFSGLKAIVDMILAIAEIWLYTILMFCL